MTTLEEAVAGAAAVEGLDIRLDETTLSLVLDRPRRRNSLTPAMVNALISVVDAAADSDVRAVALSGRETFCSGMDLGGSRDAGDRASAPAKPRAGHIVRSVQAGPHRLIRALHELPLPIVAAVRGDAAGIGLSLALAADYVAATETARFWAPFAGLGFSADSASTYLLPRLVGLARAKEMLLLGRKIDGRTAADWGLINAAVADDELDSAADTVVKEFTAAATVPIGVIKAMIRQNSSVNLAASLENEVYGVELSIRSEDFKEGMRAMAERRPPTFTGR